MAEAFHDGEHLDFIKIHKSPKNASAEDKAAYFGRAKNFMQQASGTKSRYSVHVVSVISRYLLWIAQHTM